MSIAQSLIDREAYEQELDSRLCEAILAADPFQAEHSMLSIAAQYVVVRILHVPASELAPVVAS